MANLSQYQLLPDLTPDEYQALKADIESHGVLVPVEYDDSGSLLDGHHRVRACEELGIKDWPSITRVGLTEEQKRNHVRTLNLVRRHLTKEQLKEQWAAMRADGMTYQAIADVSGVGIGTVHGSFSDLKTSESQPDYVTGKDGKKYPAKKQRKRTSVVAKTQLEQKRIQEALAGMDTEVVPDKMLDARRVARLAREQEAEKRAQEIEGDVEIGSAKLLLGDMRERGAEIEDESVDLILTDPPYPAEYLPLWGDLGKLARRVLKPNGMLITYTGAMYLPQVITLLSEHLTYWWCGAILLPGAHSRIHARNVTQGSKPILFYVKDGYVKDRWLGDTFTSEGKDKGQHDWQQSVGLSEYYISRLTEAGDLVLDPFLGAGSVGVAAIRNGRHFVGIEIDPSSIQGARERMEVERRQKESERVSL